MFYGKKRVAILAMVLGLTVFTGCGGGGGTSESGLVLPAKTLTWAPPSAYTDGTPLNPAAELDSFEIYIKESGPFTGSDSPVALVGAVNQGQLVTSFNLANLAPYITLGVQYQVSLKAVALTGAKSDFSGTATFSF